MLEIINLEGAPREGGKFVGAGEWMTRVETRKLCLRVRRRRRKKNWPINTRRPRFFLLDRRTLRNRKSLTRAAFSHLPHRTCRSASNRSCAQTMNHPPTDHHRLCYFFFSLLLFVQLRENIELVFRRDESDCRKYH